MRALHVGLIGYGMAGRVFHAPTIAAVPELRLAKVVERRGQASRERYPWVEVAREAAALFEDDAIELVVVATPNLSHFELARQALLADKHVVVDKPFTLTSAQAQDLIDLARRRNKVVSAFHNRRWDGDFQTVRQIVQQGLLGRLVEYESHFDRFRNTFSPERAWRETAGPGSGVLFDLGPHLIDQALVLFGLPRMLTADIRNQREAGKADDQFELILHYDSLKVTLKAGLLVRQPGPRFALHGTEGSFVKYGVDPQEEALKRGRSPRSRSGAWNPKSGGERSIPRSAACTSREKSKPRPVVIRPTTKTSIARSGERPNRSSGRKKRATRSASSNWPCKATPSNARLRFLAAVQEPLARWPTEGANAKEVTRREAAMETARRPNPLRPVRATSRVRSPVGRPLPGRPRAVRTRAGCLALEEDQARRTSSRLKRVARPRGSRRLWVPARTAR